jgi:acetylornithine deacetylase
VNTFHKHIQTIVDRNSRQYIEWIRDLVRAGARGEAAVQELVDERMRELGAIVEHFAYDPRSLQVAYEVGDPASIAAGERISVVGRWPGSGQGRSLLGFAHPDSEPIPAHPGWQRDPFAADIADGRLYGWGVADDLLGVAIMLCGMDTVCAADLKPAGTVTLASTPSKQRAQGVIAVLDRGYTADAALYVHPAESGAGLAEIKAFASGLLRFQIAISGQPPETSEPGHTAFAHRAVNPIDKAWPIYQALRELDAERARRIQHPVLEAAIGRSTNLLVAAIGGGDMQRLSRIANECVLAGTLTFPPGERLAGVQAEIRAAVQAAAASDPWLREHPPQISWPAGSEGAEVATGHPFYQCVSRAVARFSGKEPSVNPLHSGSDIRNPLLYRGIPTLGLGSLAGDLTHSGGHDEWIDLADYQRAIAVMAAVIVDWSGGA